MFVDDEGTGRRIFEVDGFSRSVRVFDSLENIFIDEARLRESCGIERGDWDGGASPNMKNLMKAPIRRTTESCPRRKPWVKDSLVHH